MRKLAVLLLLSLSLFVWADELPRRGALNIPLRLLTEAQQKDLKLAAQEGLFVGGAPPATAPELRQGDVIVGVGGKSFKSVGEYNALVRPYLLDTKAKLDVLRDGKKQSVTVGVAERPLDKGDNYSVVYSSVVSNGKRIRTIITRPTNFSGKRPVFFWIQGINTGSVDFPLTSDNYITRVLKPMSDAGWVTVRVEKEGTGDSEGGPAHLVDFASEVDIYRQGLKSLSKFDFADPSKIVVFGHSMGGCHAPIVCSEIPVKGIITYGTVSDSWLEWQIKSARIQGPLSGQSEADIDREVRQTTAFYHFLYNEKRSVDWIKKNRPELSEYAKSASPDGVMLSPRSIKYMTQLNDHNLSSYWEKVKEAKVLALFGENDFISIEADQTQIPQILNRLRPGSSEYRKLPGIDHGFKTTTSMKDSLDKFNGKPSVFEPSLVDVVLKWSTDVVKD